MTYQDILFSMDAGIARITLNRPDKLNSFTAQMHGELADALIQVAEKKARVLVLTGAGRGFCAGQDLNDRQMSADDAPPMTPCARCARGRAGRRDSVRADRRR